MTFSSRWAAWAVVFTLGASACTAPDASTPTGPDAPADATDPGVAVSGAETSYLVLANGNRLPGGLANRIAGAGGEVTMEIGEVGILAVRSADPGFADRASAVRGVRSVIPDPVVPMIPDEGEGFVPVSGAPSPPNTGDDDFFFDLQWGHDAVDAPEAWAGGQRGAGVRVAILDSGIDADHLDLAPNLNTALSTSFVPGEDFDELPPPPEFSHGSHVAGTVGAADNAFGAIGVAPEVELVAVKVLSAFTGSGSFGGIIAGIVYAANIDADVINMSLGAQLSHRGEVFNPNTGELVATVPASAIAELQVAVGRATSFAVQQGTTVIAAAGNAAKDGDRDRDIFVLPADAPGVIAIAATGPLGWALDPATNLDEAAFFTNVGQSVIDFAAPGGNVDFDLLASGAVCTVAAVTVPCWTFDLVFSTSNAGWSWAGGTSMASPQAAAVAAIIIGQKGGEMHPAQVEAAMRKAADDIDKPGKDDLGHGRVNAGNAVR